jgi:LPS-assembly protein
MNFTPLALAAVLLLGGGGAWGQAAALEPSTTLQALPRGDAARQLPIVLRAQQLRSQPNLETVAEGEVEFRQGGLLIRADRLAYDVPQDLASAEGHVRIVTEAATYAGHELRLKVQRFEGFFLQPEFEFTALGAGGRAERVDFLGGNRARATQAQYTSCPRDDPTLEPDWLLKARRVTLDLDANEGIAEGAVLRFLGAPILALPVLSFPLSDARKSGWLPPSIDIDNRSGVELSVPYYWNIAPNRDATVAPRVITKRGLAVDAEFRYLDPRYQGGLNLDWLPDDRIERRSRQAVQWQHDGNLPRGVFYSVDLVRVSDNAWWKDFPGATRSLTPRLLPLRAGIERPFGWGSGEGALYARATQWQVLQSADSLIAPPYERSPQVGLGAAGAWGGLHYQAETEYNSFTLPRDEAARSGRYTGSRWHVLSSLSHPWRDSSGWVVPRVSLNAAAYDTDWPLLDRERQVSRVIPSFSLDTGLEFERQAQAFGRTLRQTLEPRLLYVNTPYRAQSELPNYDSAGKDFNFVSIYSDNAFSGVDRVADANQLTAGVTTRLVDAASGVEALRLGLVQRYLFRRQRVTPQADGTPDGAPLEQRFSDALLLGSTSVFPGWNLDAAVQYSPDIKRSVRSIAGARYSPGPFRTVSTTYRFARGLSEQLEVGWQWPIAGAGSAGTPSPRPQSSACSGAWYSVGRVNYSLKDRRVTDSILGLEFDAGCWIGRVVAERLSTGRSEATTRLLLQLELVGLSRIGSNPLKVLKDNIPGYRLLREDRRSAFQTDDRSLESPAP